MSEESKIAYGWCLIGINGHPVSDSVSELPEIEEREQECVVMWRHDYEHLTESLKHREELYWKLTAEFDAMRGELVTLSNAIRMLDNYLANDAQMDHALELEALKISDRYKTTEDHD